MKIYTGIKPCIQEAGVQKNTKLQSEKKLRNAASKTEPIQLNNYLIIMIFAATDNTTLINL